MMLAPQGDIVVSSVVGEELLFGAYLSAQVQKNLAEVRALLSALPSIPFDDRAAEFGGRIRAGLERSGKRIGYNDMLIAAIALANDLIMVTHNVAEFSRVPGLKVEDWQTTP